MPKYFEVYIELYKVSMKKATKVEKLLFREFAEKSEKLVSRAVTLQSSVTTRVPHYSVFMRRSKWKCEPTHQNDKSRKLKKKFMCCFENFISLYFAKTWLFPNLRELNDRGIEASFEENPSSTSYRHLLAPSLH